MKPAPPLLFVRPGLAFWVEPAWTGTVEATLQAFEEGCFDGTWCLDSAGVRRPIVRAELVRKPGLLDRLLLWRRMPVRLELGQAGSEPWTAAIEEIRRVLHSPEFDYEGQLPIQELDERLLAVGSPAALVELACEAVERAA
jgi:hypothetical protein